MRLVSDLMTNKGNMQVLRKTMKMKKTKEERGNC